MFVDRIMKTPRTCTSLGIMQKIHLIECVRLQPCIWDTNHESFKSCSARQAAFNEIAQLLSDHQNHFTRSQMQDEWGKIRYCFTRIIKKFLSTEDEAEAVSWPYWEKMQFMYEIIKDHLLSQNSPCDVSLGSRSFRKQMKTSTRGRTRLSNQRLTPSTPSGLSPNRPIVSNPLAVINNQKYLSSGPTHTNFSPARAERPSKSVFDLADDRHPLLADKYTKQEGEEDMPCLAKGSRTGEDRPKDWAHAAQQFLSSIDSLPTSSNGVSSSSIALSEPQNGCTTSSKNGRHQTPSTGEIVRNSTPLEDRTVESGKKEVDTSEYFEASTWCSRCNLFQERTQPWVFICAKI